VRFKLHLKYLFWLNLKFLKFRSADNGAAVDSRDEGNMRKIRSSVKNVKEEAGIYRKEGNKIKNIIYL